MAVESIRSGWRKASRYRAATGCPFSARWRMRRRLAAMNAISEAERTAETRTAARMPQT
jgi:hypothetical protein